MLSGILLLIIGAWLEAPWWYFLLCGVQIFISFLRFEIAALEKEQYDE